MIITDQEALAVMCDQWRHTMLLSRLRAPITDDEVQRAVTIYYRGAGAHATLLWDDMQKALADFLARRVAERPS